MKYQLTGGWPLGQWFIPPGTIVDFTAPSTQWGNAEMWTQGLVPPPNALALDQDCSDQMKLAYPQARGLMRANGLT